MLKSQNFYFRSSVFVTLSLIGAVINYLLYPVLSRIFNLSQFGDYVTIVALSTQLMGLLLAFSVISIALVKRYGEDEAHAKAQTIQKVLLWLFLGLSLLVLVLTPFLQHLLKIEHAASFLILVLIMLLAVPSNIWMGFLQGHKEQVRVGIFTAATAALKFVWILGLAVPFGVIGGLWGFFIGSALGLVVVYYLPGKPVPRFNTLLRPLQSTEVTFLKEHKGYIIQAVIVVAGIVFLQNYDLNRAKALFSPSVAGVYGGISVFSNALYYVAFLLIWVLLPEFNTKVAAINKRILTTAYRLIALLTVVVIAGGLALGNTLLPIVLGHNFAHQGTTLVVASLYQISLVSVALYAFYLLVLRKRRSLWLVGAILICCLLIPLHFTSSPLAMVTSLWLSVLAGTGIYALISRRLKPVIEPL